MAKRQGKKPAGSAVETENQVQAPAAATAVAEKPAEPAPAAPEAPAANNDGQKKDSVFLNRISDKMIRPVANAKDGKDWTAVSFGIAGPDGKPAIGSILVRSKQVRPSTKRGPGGEKLPNPGFKNVLLGQPNQHYNVSLNVKDANGDYVQQRMSTEEIKNAVDEANKAYRAQKKAAQQAKDTSGIDTPADTKKGPDGPDGPEK